MTPSDASRVIETRFSDQWDFCPVVYENTPARDWNDIGQPSLFDGSEPFLLLEISPGYSRAVTVPVGCVRRSASVLCSIMIPRDVGSRRVDDIISELSDLLQYRTLTDATGDLRFKDLSTVSRNVIIDEWVRTVVAVSFEYDHEVL